MPYQNRVKNFREITRIHANGRRVDIRVVASLIVNVLSLVWDVERRTVRGRLHVSIVMRRIKSWRSYIDKYKCVSREDVCMPDSDQFEAGDDVFVIDAAFDPVVQRGEIVVNYDKYPKSMEVDIGDDRRSWTCHPEQVISADADADEVDRFLSGL